MLLAEPKLSVAQRKKLKDKMLLEKFGSDLISLPYKESEQIIHEDVIQDLIDQDVLKELNETTSEEGSITPDSESAPNKIIEVRKRRKNKISVPNNTVPEQSNIDIQQVRRSARHHKGNKRYV